MLNLQEEDWKQLDIPLNRAALANWIIYCTENYLRHVYDYFHRQLLMRKYLMADETEYSDAIVHAFRKFRAPFSGKIVHTFPEQSAVI